MINKTEEHAKVGMRVYVKVCAETDETPTCGTITKVEQLIAEETDEVLSEHFPTITLDDGRIVNGMECWWCPFCAEHQSEEE